MSPQNEKSVRPNKPDWYFYEEGQKTKPVCTFIPEVICVIKSDGSDSQEDIVRVRLQFKKGETAEVEISISQLDKVDWFKKDKRCIVNSRYRGACGYIADTIRAGINNAPTEVAYTFNRLGIHHLDNITVFAAGDRVITPSSATEPKPNLKSAQSSFRLDVDDGISTIEALEGMAELISLSPEIGRVLVSHAISGIIRRAFKEAGMIPCAVLVIVGESGMFKSEYVPLMVQLYNRADGIGAVTRFNSTKRYIEDVLYEYSECTAVIDDLHTAESTGIKKRNEDTAEEIIRRIGDNTGRGHMEGNSHVQKQFQGNVAFIGEYTIGKASTIPRALVINLTKQPDGKILDIYQRAKNLIISTAYFRFIQWYVDHFEDVRKEIDNRLSNFRRRPDTSIASIHGRLRDTYFYLSISYMFFLEFCQDSGFLSKEEVLNEYRCFNAYLGELVLAQQSKYKSDQEGEELDYLGIIRDLYQNGRFSLAKNKKKFNPEKHDGVIHYDCLCLRRECLDLKIKSILPNANINDCINFLKSKNALKLVDDKNTVKINDLGKGFSKRFYAIWIKNLK